MKPILPEESGSAVYVQIAQTIVRDIQRQRLKPGSALPSSRELATLLDVNRKTVMLAYDELISQGWIVSQGRRGTFVSAELPLSFRIARETGAIPVRPAPREPAFELRSRTLPLALDTHGNTPVAFSDGVPDTRLVPHGELARIQNAQLRSLGRRNGLSYGFQAGEPALRAGLAEMLNNERGLNISSDEICVTRGSQMAIYLVAQTLCRPGDTVVFEELSYPPAWEAFRHAGADVVSAPMDADGLDPDALEAICRARRVTAIYLTPHHQFPTTALMRMPRRMRLLELAEMFRFAIVEDDYDHEFHFQRKPVLPLAASDQGGRVVYIGSLSKLLAPGLRCGYLVATRPFIHEVEKLVLLIDRCGNPVVEATLAEALSSGLIKRHAARSLRTYEARLEHAKRRLSEDFEGLMDFKAPAGGLALWARLREGLDIDALAAEAGRRGLSLVAGSRYSLKGLRVDAFRLGYAAHTEAEMSALLAGLHQACLAVTTRRAIAGPSEKTNLEG